MPAEAYELPAPVSRSARQSTPSTLTLTTGNPPSLYSRGLSRVGPQGCKLMCGVSVGYSGTVSYSCIRRCDVWARCTFVSAQAISFFCQAWLYACSHARRGSCRYNRHTSPSFFVFSVVQARFDFRVFRCSGSV